MLMRCADGQSWFSRVCGFPTPTDVFADEAREFALRLPVRATAVGGKRSGSLSRSSLPVAAMAALENSVRCSQVDSIRGLGQRQRIGAQLCVGASIRDGFGRVGLDRCPERISKDLALPQIR